MAAINELVYLLSKLNPWAKEFVPSSKSSGKLSADAPVFVTSSADYYNVLFDDGFDYVKGIGSDGSVNFGDQQPQFCKRRNGYNQGRRSFIEKAQNAQKEDCIRRTVYVSDIDQHVTEEHLAALFNTCGQDCFNIPEGLSNSFQKLVCIHIDGDWSIYQHESLDRRVNTSNNLQFVTQGRCMIASPLKNIAAGINCLSN